MMSAVRGIRYEEGTNTGYKGVYVHYGDSEEKLFNSGNFVKDWYDMMKWYIMGSEEIGEYLVSSSSVDHFIMDGAPYDSAYLIPDSDGKNSRLDYAESVWDECIDNGIEFFVPEGTKPTWEELKKCVSNER